jgi:hypothetical protein
MLFNKKGKLRRAGDDRLLLLLIKLKNEWQTRKEIIEKSVEPSNQVIHEFNLVHAKYFFLLKEAKIRGIRMEKIK